ncbi:MAG: hypothetical protein JW754_02760 [Candidatus Aenigmarchaeota archaeon]|nr:hypothetical protein [Candidatus Aenigmarchaeota archaeon]
MAKKEAGPGEMAASVFGVITVIFYISILMVSPLVLLFCSPAGYGEIFSYAYFFALSLVSGFVAWLLMVRKGVLKEHNLLLSLIAGFFISLIMAVNSMIIAFQNMIRAEMEAVAVPQYMQAMMISIPKVGDPVLLFFVAYLSFSVFFFFGYIRGKEWKKLLYYVIPVATFLVAYLVLQGMLRGMISVM